MSVDAMKKRLDEVKKKLRHKPSKVLRDLGGGLSTGSTLLNLALTGHTSEGFARGCYYLLVGDSKAGKTFLALQTLAEASINKDFEGYKLIYDGPEKGARMDLEKFFGKRLAERIEAPLGTKEVPQDSDTVESFYYHLDDALEHGPCVYVLDSMDALIPQDDVGHFLDAKKAHSNGKEVGGSYGLAKAKLNSANLRVACSKLEKNGSILIVISQSRENIGFGSQFNPKTRSGGTALRFYATGEMWFSVKETLKKTVRGKPRGVGTALKVAVKKNRSTGREPIVELHHYPSCGLDDLGSMVEYLIEEKAWSETKGRVKASDFEFEGTREDLIDKIQKEKLGTELKMLVGGTWREIEEACSVARDNRYGE